MQPPKREQTINVMLVDDHLLVRRGFRRLLEDDSEIAVVAEAGDGPEAVQLAELQDTWQPHPSRDHQHIAFVQGVEHLWEACQVPLNACVIR